MDRRISAGFNCVKGVILQAGLFAFGKFDCVTIRMQIEFVFIFERIVFAMTPQEQIQFRILRAIEQNPDITQRELARHLGVSNGKAHYLLTALIEKGLLKMGSFRRNDNKMAKVAYLLTAEGVRNRIQLTRDYLARKEAEYQALQNELASLRAELPSIDALLRESGSVHYGIEQ